MHMYRRRPRPQPVVPESDWAHGRCYLASQSALVFGSDRQVPVEWRPVISWAVLGPNVYVLPSTTKQRNDFFLLCPDRCFLKRSRSDSRDSYLCPRAEAVSTTELIELGTLDHSTRLAIAQWKRAREENLG